MRWRRVDEAVEVLQFRFAYFPRVFRWRGCRYRVERVDECWTISRSGWRRRVDRHWFRLRCAAGVFEIYHDLIANTWHLGRYTLERAEEPIGEQVFAGLRNAHSWEARQDESHVGGVALV